MFPESKILHFPEPTNPSSSTPFQTQFTSKAAPKLISLQLQACASLLSTSSPFKGHNEPLLEKTVGIQNMRTFNIVYMYYCSNILWMLKIVHEI